MKISKFITSKLFGVSITALLLSATFLTPALAEAKGDAAKGAQKWANNCARCHNMRDPKECPWVWHKKQRPATQLANVPFSKQSPELTPLKQIAPHVIQLQI